MKGWSELCLVVAVCLAGWTRTPMVDLFQNGWALAHGGPRVDLLAHFRTGLPGHMRGSLQNAVARKGDPQPLGLELPPGWTPALWMAAQVHLGPEALEQVTALPVSDPLEALEVWAVGAELRERAIGRARAIGADHPERYAVHRRFLPAEQARRGDEAVSQVLTLVTVLDMDWPVDCGVRVTSPFGWRVHPVTGGRRFHEGVDLAVSVGTPVHAVGAGRVVRAREDGVNGKYVVVDHGFGVTTAYCHGSTLRVSAGQQVTRGQVVMDSGSTGRSTGPHLHFGLRIDGRATDPILFRRAAAGSGGDGG